VLDREDPRERPQEARPMAKEPPGPRLLREFVESLGTLEGVSLGTAEILQDLYKKGLLRSNEITAALRAARTSEIGHDKNSQA
jgi:hypothetical protein